MIDYQEDPASTALSSGGTNRRQEILKSAQRALTARRRRHTALRAGTATAAFALVGLSVVLALRHERSDVPTNIVQANVDMLEPTADHGITLVRDEPGITARLAARPTSTVITIDDDGLEAMLEEAGRPTGTVRTGGRVYLATNLSTQ